MSIGTESLAELLTDAGDWAELERIRRAYALGESMIAGLLDALEDRIDDKIDNAVAEILAAISDQAVRRPMR